MADPSVAVSVVLAEFAALRAEIDRRSTAQHALIGLMLTVASAVSGTVLLHGELVHLLLAVPFVAGAFGMLFIDHHWMICTIGRYIGGELHPVIRELAASGKSDLDARLLAWEERVEWKRDHVDGFWWQGSMIGSFAVPAFGAAAAWCLAVAIEWQEAHVPILWRTPAYAALLAGIWLNISVVKRWRNNPLDQTHLIALERRPNMTRTLLAATAFIGGAAAIGCRWAAICRWEREQGLFLLLGIVLVAGGATVARRRSRHGYDTFRRLFTDAVRVELKWAELDRLRPTVSTLVPSAAELSRWHAPWYVSTSGEVTTYEEEGARPVTFGELEAEPDLVAPERRRVIAAFAASFAERPSVLTVATVRVPGGQLVIDGNHRVAAVVRSGAEVRVVAYSVHVPMDETILPDLRHWAKGRGRR